MAELELILMRHGNTFAPGDTVVWVGSSLDLPLVASGEEQARACAAALKARLPVDRIYAGPLRRTRQCAEIVRAELKLSNDPIIDARLNELDYGQWSGLSKEEVVRQFGAEELHAWELSGVRPKKGGWGGSEEQVLAEVTSFVEDLRASLAAPDPPRRVVAVSSNGRLRYFLRLVPGEFERRAADGSLSVKTGRFCRLTINAGAVQVREWGISPEEFAVFGKRRNAN